MRLNTFSHYLMKSFAVHHLHSLALSLGSYPCLKRMKKRTMTMKSLFSFDGLWGDPLSCSWALEACLLRKFLFGAILSLLQPPSGVPLSLSDWMTENSLTYAARWLQGTTNRLIFVACVYVIPKCFSLHCYWPHSICCLLKIALKDCSPKIVCVIPHFGYSPRWLRLAKLRCWVYKHAVLLVLPLPFLKVRVRTFPDYSEKWAFTVKNCQLPSKERNKLL